MDYKVGQTVEVIANVGGHKFNIGDHIQITRIDKESGEITAEDSSGEYWFLVSDEVKALEEQNMTIKTNDKVKFSDAAKGLKSYDADAVGVVTKEFAGNTGHGSDMYQVTFAYPCGRKQHINTISGRNLELIEEEQITLRQGDWCGDKLTKDQYGEVFDCFVNAGASVYEDKDYKEFKGCTNIAWTDGDSDTFHSGNPYTSPFCLRQLTYSQIVNATNAKPEKKPSEPEAAEGDNDVQQQKTIDSALQELKSINDQIESLTNKREELKSYISERCTDIGVAVSFGAFEVQVEEEITEWHQLQPGDVIEIVSVSGGDAYQFTEGKHYTVSEAEPKYCNDDCNVEIEKDDKGDCNWLDKELTKWRFVSRPSK